MAEGQMDLNQKLCIPNINSVRFGKGFVQYFGPVIWNSIPAKIRNVKTLSSFKKKIENGSHQIVIVNFV